MSCMMMSIAWALKQINCSVCAKYPMLPINFVTAVFINVYTYTIYIDNNITNVLLLPWITKKKNDYGWSDRKRKAIKMEWKRERERESERQ